MSENAKTKFDKTTANFSTLAKSGTSEFLARAESDTSTENTGNLIGAFGLGFYSSFLVADRVEVASIPAASEKNPAPEQHVTQTMRKLPSKTRPRKSHRKRRRP